MRISCMKQDIKGLRSVHQPCWMSGMQRLHSHEAVLHVLHLIGTGG